jgi:hypothetical protein
MNIKRLLRLKRTWLLFALVLYTVAGFFVAPRIIRNQALSQIQLNLGRDAEIEKVRLNPYTLSMAVEGFALRDPDGTVFVGFDELAANLQLRSILRWAWSIGEVRLDNPHVNVRVMPDSTLNFSDMIGQVEERVAEQPELEEEWTKVPRLILQRLRINGALITAVNLAAVEPESLSVRPADLDLRDFSTLPNRQGQYELSAVGHGGGRWVWVGDLQFDPLHASGTFTLARSSLPQFWRVIRNRVDFEVADGDLALSLDYRVDVDGENVEAAITEATIEVDDLAIREKGTNPTLFAVDSLRVSGVHLRYPEQSLDVERIAIHGPELQAWLMPDSTLNWEALAPELPAQSVQESPGTPADPWSVRLREVVLIGGSVHAEDRTTNPVFAVDLNSINVTLQDVRSEPGSRFRLESDLVIAERGRLGIVGQVGAQPPAADLAVGLSDFPVPILQPYLNPFADLRIVSGSFGVDGSLHFAQGDSIEIGFVGSASSADLLARDLIAGDEFVGWDRLELTGIDYSTSSLVIGEVAAERPRGKVHIAKDRSTNIEAIFAKSLPDSTAEPSPAGKSLPIQVGRVKLNNGWLDFTDESLILPVAAGIDSLSGRISGLSSDAQARADVDLSGLVHPNGIASVQGELNPLSEEIFLDLDVLFEDFDLPVLTPYSGQYIGREIDKGKLRLDLEYRLEDRHLVGDNHIVLEQLEYGDDIDSPDATSLPVGLATALLKDSRGNIDLEVSVEGDVDDPGFSIWDAVFDVLRNTITKVATAPFKLLGSLVGMGDDSDELAWVSYAPGDTTLTVTEREDLLKLATALNERPELRLEVRGQVHPEADGAALREAEFEARMATWIARDPKRFEVKEADAYPSRLLREMFDEAYGEDQAERLEALFQTPQLDDEGRPRGDRTELDEAAYYGHLRQSMVDDIPIPDAQYQRLGIDRSAHIKAILARDGGIAETRIFLLDVDDNAALENGLVRLGLAVTD